MDINELIRENENIRLKGVDNYTNTTYYNLYEDGKYPVIIAKITVSNNKFIGINFTEDSYVSHIENVVKAILKGE